MEFCLLMLDVVCASNGGFASSPYRKYAQGFPVRTTSWGVFRLVLVFRRRQSRIFVFFLLVFLFLLGWFRIFCFLFAVRRLLLCLTALFRRRGPGL